MKVLVVVACVLAAAVAQQIPDIPNPQEYIDCVQNPQNCIDKIPGASSIPGFPGGSGSSSESGSGSGSTSGGSMPSIPGVPAGVIPSQIPNIPIPGFPSGSSSGSNPSTPTSS